MRLPADMVYPFIKLGAKLFGGFNLDEACPLEAVKHSKTPIVFIHGEADDYVPYEMSVRMYEACSAPKKLVPIPGAGHGLAFPVNKQAYIQGLKDFQDECGF